MRTSKFLLGPLIVALVLGVGASAFWAGHASSGSPSSEVKTYQPGWANIAWLDDTAPVGTALSSIADSVGVVYYLDPDSGSWQRYIPGRPEVSTLTTMAFGKSYLLLFTKPATLEQATQPDDVCAPSDCPSCPTSTPCPTATPCPDCPPTSGDSLTSYLLQDECTAAKVIIELAEITDTEATEAELFFTWNCQDVQFLAGSPLSSACSGAGILQGAAVIPGAPSELLIAAQEAAVLVGQYCVP